MDERRGDEHLAGVAMQSLCCGRREHLRRQPGEAQRGRARGQELRAALLLERPGRDAALLQLVERGHHQPRRIGVLRGPQLCRLEQRAGLRLRRAEPLAVGDLQHVCARPHRAGHLDTAGRSGARARAIEPRHARDTRRADLPRERAQRGRREIPFHFVRGADHRARQAIRRRA